LGRWPKNKGSNQAAWSFAGTTEKRTKDDDDDEDDGRKPSLPSCGLLLRFSDLPFVLVVVVVLASIQL
jgi:hypothetical protein